MKKERKKNQQNEALTAKHSHWAQTTIQKCRRNLSITCTLNRQKKRPHAFSQNLLLTKDIETKAIRGRHIIWNL
jgi:hypothetical protein